MQSPEGSTIDHGWAWLVMLGGSLWNFVFTGSLKSFGLFYLEFQDWFKCSPSEASTVGLFFGLMLIISAPLSGLVADYGSVRVITIVCGIMAAGGVIISSQAPTLLVAVMGYGCLTGFASGVIDVPVLSMVGKYFNKYRTFATGVMFTGSSVGTLAIPQIFASVRDVYGSRTALLTIGAIWFNACVVGALMRPIRFASPTNIPKSDKQKPRESQADNLSVEGTNGNSVNRLSEEDCFDSLVKNNCSHEDNEYPTPGVIGGCEKAENHVMQTESLHECDNARTHTNKQSISSRFRAFTLVLRSYIGLLKNGHLLVRLFTVNTCALGYFLPIIAMPPLCRELNIDTQRAANLISVFGLVEIPARIAISFMTERFKCRPPVVLLVSALSNLIMTIVIVSKPSYITLMIFSVAHGLVGGTVFLFLNTMLVEAVHVSQLGRAMALLTVVFGVVAAVLTPITGLVKESSGTHLPVFGVSSSASLLGAITYAVVSCIESRKSHRPSSIG